MILAGWRQITNKGSQMKESFFPCALLWRFLMVFVGLVVPVSALAVSTPPQVVASIKPVHALVSAVMKGLGTPQLLVTNPAAAHHFALRPSQARMLQNAKLLVWIGPEMELTLVDAVPPLAADLSSLSLIKSKGLTLHRIEYDDEKEHDDHDGHKAHIEGDLNPHIWLNPDNVKLMLSEIAARLAEIDPQNGSIYRANAMRAATGVDKAATRLVAEMAPLMNKGFVVFHDAHIYFERYVGIRARTAITSDPDVPPRPRRLRAIRHMVEDREIRCIFSEVGVSSKAVEVIAEGYDVRLDVLDPLGSQIAAEEDFFTALLTSYGDAFTRCLGP